MIEEIKKMPKVELHIHLDGSISLELAEKLSNNSITLIKEKMIARDKCENLSEYLTKFEFPISLMQTKENLIKVAKDLVYRLSNQNVIYVEVRFAPMFHTKNGLTYEEIIDFKIVQCCKEINDINNENKIYVVYEFDYGNIDEGIEPNITIFDGYKTRAKAMEKANELLQEGLEKYYIDSCLEDSENPFKNYDELHLYENESEE